MGISLLCTAFCSLVLLVLVDTQTGVTVRLEELIEKCCILGKNWQSRGSCDRYPTPIRGVPSLHQMNCLSTLRVCCINKWRPVQCTIGKQVAKTHQKCNSISSTESDEQKECCECCKLGIVARGVGMSCNGTTISKSCDASFTECCLSKVEKNPLPQSKTGVCARYQPRLCTHICIDVPGVDARDRPNFRCDCPDNLQLDNSARRCRPKPKPTRGNANNCNRLNPCQQTCIDTGVEIKCDCTSGFILNSDGRSCRPIGSQNSGRGGTNRPVTDPPSTNIPPVPINQQRPCRRGYHRNQITRACQDVNECLNNPCVSSMTCYNTPGSYVCRRGSCGTGYTLQDTTQQCQDIDECSDPSLNNCGIAFNCINMQGSFRCVYKTCPSGQRLNGRSGRCVQVDCQDGYRVDPTTGRCIDIDECDERPALCGIGRRCTNTDGAYNCITVPDTTTRCGQGYAPDANGICKDIDECADGSQTRPRCSRGQTCINRPGTYDCQCSDGYQLNQLTKACDDVDECSKYGQVCAGNSDCQNTIGSYTCQCKPGFKALSDGRGCEDSDECTEQTGACAHNCHNTWGSYQCTCREGYTLSSDKRSCVDIDECSQKNERWRPCIGQCTNTLGSFTCSCPSGYKLLPGGRVCQDIDECAVGTAKCNGPNQMCVNTRGSFRCNTINCPQNFIRSVGRTQKYIRCTRASFVCRSGDEKCLTAPLSYSYNFITFPGKLVRVPTRLFKMRGPAGRRLEFELQVESAKDPITGAQRVQRDFFNLKRESGNEAIVSMLREIKGPMDIVLQLKMHVYTNQNIFFGTAIARIYLYVTAKDF